MSTLTALLGSNIMGAGTKVVRATFAGPAVYVAGGTPCNLASKPALATPVSDAALTSPMLTSRVDDVRIQIPSTMEPLYRVRYVPSAAAAPAFGLAKVFGPAAVLTELEFDFTDLAAAALTNQLTVVPVINPGTRVVGAEVEIVTPFGGGAVATLTFDVGEPIVDADGIVNGVDLLAAAAGTVDRTPGVLGVAGMWQPAVAGTIEMEATSTVANLNALTAGEGIVRVWTVDHDAFGDPATWGEVAAGTNLLAAGLTFNVTAVGM